MKCSGSEARLRVAWPLRSERGRIAGLREFVVQFGTEERRARGGASLAGRMCLCRARLTSSVAAEGAPAGVRMGGLPPVGIGDRWNGVPPDANRSDQLVFAAYLMGRDKRGVSAKFLQRD